MRKNKFRGKCVKTGKWIYGHLYRGTLALTDTPIYTAIMEDGDLFHVNSDTIGEFTGIHDKYKNEIYAGDLLKDEGNFIWEVIFDKGKFICENIHTPGTKAVQSDAIVGNIHDGIDLDECNCFDKDCESCRLYFAENI